MSGCGPQRRPPTVPAPCPTADMRVQEGMASWYGPGFHGKQTSSGERYDMNAMTAAHATLPLGTIVRVTNLDNRLSVVVRVNDRGPFVKGRILDLSYAAARRLDMIERGTAWIRLDVLRGPDWCEQCDLSLPPYFTLQMGSFVDEANARELKKQLDGILGSGRARVVPARLGDLTLFRVRVGRYADGQKAYAMADELTKQGYTALVTMEYVAEAPSERRGDNDGKRPE
jgi:rare lipoprotein A